MSTKEDLQIVDVNDYIIPQPEYPGQAVAYWSKPKDKAVALNRILGMDSGFNQGMFNTKIHEYKEKFNITDKDIKKWHTRMQNSRISDGGSKRKTRKHRKRCSCCKSYKCKCPKNCKGCKHGKSRKSHKSRKSRKSHKSHKSRK